MSGISRKCVPFTPFDRELSRASVAIVTAAGVHRKDQEGFNIADELGDLTFRVIGSEGTAADSDINVVFPIDALRELVKEGFIGGEAREHVGYMGYTMQLKRMYEETARQIAEEIDKKSRAD